MAYRLIRHADGRIETTEVAGPALRIGRGTNADLRFDDTAVALEHARIEQTDGGFLLTDLGGVTGCYVNGSRVTSTRLAGGDRIEIGPFLIDVTLPRGPGESVALDVRPVAGARAARGAIDAKPIDYAKAYALNRWFANKPLLTLVATAGLGALLSGILWAGKTELFRPGSVTVAHALFTNQCERCHTAWTGVSEKACRGCHVPAVHHDDQADAPSCLACHAEHRGQAALAGVATRDCVACHRQLQTKDHSPLSFADRTTDFATDHPEFAITRVVNGKKERVRLDVPGARRADAASIKLNHKVHLKPALKGPKGPVQLACRDCHLPAEDGARMAPVTYQERCKGCHELGFDPRFPDRVVPHVPPADVRAYLVAEYTENAGALVSKGGGADRLAGPRFPGPARSPSLEWVMEQVAVDERHLYTSACPECHAVRADARPVPEIEPTRVPSSWLSHARFAHRSHAQLECGACHENVEKSADTSDVLLPGIEICRRCHRAADPTPRLQADRASIDCVACHRYHDGPAKPGPEGSFTIRRLLDGVDPGRREPRPMSEGPQT
ncbi:MAG: FHA domain-containing protein [Nitrospirae bacterium]|nr:FHA domain-containing protein [Nitrospirota bacterium]